SASFVNAPPPTQISTLSLHDALPILEEALRRARIPYVIVGGVRFYERREIKDTLAYLRLVVNAADDVAFRRAIAAPSRGIGPGRSEEHTSELQSRFDLVCRLLLEKKK